MTDLSKEDVIKQLKAEKPIDYYENSLIRKIYLQAAGITLIVLLVIFLAELLIARRFDLLVWGIGFTFMGSGLLLEGKNFNKPSKLIIGILLLLAALIAIIGGFLIRG